MSEEAIVIRISTEGPRTRITVDVPESVRTALKAKSLVERRSQSDLTTEALIKFFTAPIGSFPSPKVQIVKEGTQ